MWNKLDNYYKKHKKRTERTLKYILYKVYRVPKGQSKMENPKKLATWGTQDENKQNKNTTQYVIYTNKDK